MPATPADIAKYTNDGVLISAQDFTIRDNFPDAQDSGDSEIEMFYVTAADGQAMLDEKFAILSQIAPPHEGIEVADSLNIGTTIPIAPVIPSWRCIDPERDMDVNLRTAAYGYEMGSDRYSVEVRK